MTTLDYFSLGHPFARVRSRYALRARTRMFEQFMHNVAPNAAETVLDLGVTPDHSLEESNFFEALYPWPQRITAASIESPTTSRVISRGAFSSPTALPMSA